MNSTYKNTWSVLVYTLILVGISFIMALAILSLSSLLASNAEYQDITRKLSNNVISKWKLSIKYTNFLNSNGSGFIDTIGCPSNVTMSGTVHISTSATTLWYQSGSILCRGIHNSNPFEIWFSTWGLDDANVSYLWETVSTNLGVASTNFSDGDATLVTFSASFPLSPDSFDDNFDSDNFHISSTGSTLYPEWYQDDDVLARKIVYGYATPNQWFTNMLWTNSETSEYISNNTNNADGVNEILWSMTSSWKVFLDINQPHRLKVYVFDKWSYNATRELIPKATYESTDILGRVGYLQEINGELSISTGSTVDDFEFDFTLNDYGLFVKNNGGSSLLYKLQVYTQTGTWVYINPIDDSSSVDLKVLANDIIIDSQGRFLSEQFEVLGFKE